MTSSRRRITSLICSSRRDSSLLGDDTLGRLFWVIDSFEMPARAFFPAALDTWKLFLAPRRSGVNRAENHHGIRAYHASQRSEERRVGKERRSRGSRYH